jgi:hypothetical protein
MMLMAVGMGLTMAPATESIMGALPRAKAGVGSAVNDTTRQVGGALGVAIVGSVLASTYGNQVADFLRGKNVPTGVGHTIEHSPLGVALEAGAQIPGLAEAATNGFIDGMHSGLLVAAGAALLGALIAFVFLPARSGPPAAEPEFDRHGDAIPRSPERSGSAGVPEPALESRRQ